MELEQLRTELDSIDKQMVELYEKRLDIIMQVAYCKLKNNKEVLDVQRESEKIQQVKTLLKDSNNSDGVEALYTGIMAESRQIQSAMIEKYKNTKESARGKMVKNES